MSATPRTDALEKAVSLGMVGSQLFAEVRVMEKELEAMTEGLKIASAMVENLQEQIADLRWSEKLNWPSLTRTG